MSILKNKDIYDSGQGNPFEPVVKMLGVLDEKIIATTNKMQLLEKSIKGANSQGNSSEAKQIIENTSKLSRETERLTALQKAELSIKNQIITAEAKLVASYSAEAEQLEHVKVETQVLNKIKTEGVKLASQLIGAYEKESIKLNQLRKQYKDLAVEEKGSSLEAKELLFQINRLDAKLKSVDASVGQFQRNVGNYTSALRGYGAQLLGAAGITGGFAFFAETVKNAFKLIKEFEKGLASLSAITGASGKDLEFLENKAREMSGQYGKSALEIVDAFKLVGSQKPELLKNADALQQVTDKVIVLSDATGMDLTSSASAVTAVMNQFGLGADKAGKIINSLAAGSLEGSAEVGNITESLKNFGTVANASNLTVEQSIALIEVLGEKQIFGAEAGTKLRGATLKLKEANLGYQSGIFNMNDALVEANLKMNEFGTAAEKDAYLQKIFGAENITVGQILLQNRDKFNLLTKAVTDTNVAYEQASKMNDTLAKDLAKASSAWQNFVLGIENGQGIISKSVREGVQGWTEFLNNLTAVNNENKTTEERFKSLANVLQYANPFLTFFNDLLKDTKYGLFSLIPGLDKAIDGIRNLLGLTGKYKETEKSNAEQQAKLDALRKQNIESLKKSKDDELLATQNRLAIEKELNEKRTKEEQAEYEKRIEAKKKFDAEIIRLSNERFAREREIESAGGEQYHAELEKQLQAAIDFETRELEAIDIIRTEYNQKQSERLKKLSEDEIKRQEDIAKAVKESAELAGAQFAKLLEDGQLTMREFGKYLLMTMINVAERMLFIGIFEIWLKQLAQKGLAGIATAGVITGIVKGLFQVAKSSVMNFATGTDYVNGPGTGTSDSINARLSKGEGVINAKNNMNLLRTGIGVNDKRLPGIVNAGLSTLAMENKLSNIENHLAQSNWYLSNFEMYHEDAEYKYIKDIKTGITHRIIKA